MFIVETKFSKKAKKLKFTIKQIEFVIGSLLGDGYLDKTTCGYSLRIHHSFIQKDYVDWKYLLVKDFVNSPPKRSKKSYYFRTVSHPILPQIRALFYQKRTKVISKELLEKHLGELALAIWIMDDGAREGKSIRINTQSFTKEENLWLIEFLRAKLGIKTTLNRDRKKFRLRVRKESIPLLKLKISKYIIPSMLYKLPP